MSDLVRCPVCRDTVERTEAARRVHMKTHSTWEMFRANWGLDRRYAVLTVALAASVGALLLVVWWLVFYG